MEGTSQLVFTGFLLITPRLVQDSHLECEHRPLLHEGMKIYDNKKHSEQVEKVSL